MELMAELKQRSEFFNEKLAGCLKQGSPNSLYDAVRYLPLAGGKRLRPIIAMLACESVGGDFEVALPFGASLELVHNFTLVHDDIMDKSKLRRNLPTVHATFGEPLAILAGDTLFAKAFEILHGTSVEPSVLNELSFNMSKYTQEICEGQQLDMEFEKRKKVTEEEYLEMIEKKTAVLFAFASQGGAIIGNGSLEEIKSLKNYGKFLGLAFQMWDDYLDLNSNEKKLGKDIGNDVRNGKKTLIVIHSMINADDADKNILVNMLGNKNASESDIKKVVNVFKKTGSLLYVKKKALDFSEKAKKSLDVLRDSHAKTILRELADYSISREK